MIIRLDLNILNARFLTDERFEVEDGFGPSSLKSPPVGTLKLLFLPSHLPATSNFLNHHFSFTHCKEA